MQEVQSYGNINICVPLNIDVQLLRKQKQQESKIDVQVKPIVNKIQELDDILDELEQYENSKCQEMRDDEYDSDEEELEVLDFEEDSVFGNDREPDMPVLGKRQRPQEFETNYDHGAM